MTGDDNSTKTQLLCSTQNNDGLRLSGSNNETYSSERVLKTIRKRRSNNNNKIATPYKKINQKNLFDIHIYSMK